MNKVEKAIHSLVSDVLHNISSNHDIDLNILQESVAPLLVDPNKFERCQGLVASKKNLPVCKSKVVPGTRFCRRHTLLPEEEDAGLTQPVSRHQCMALVNNGTRCVRHAKLGHDICGIHIAKKVYEQRNQDNQVSRIQCVYYDDADDDDVEFCDGYSVNDEWFCKKHKHLQPMYERLYGSKNVQDYKTNGTKTVHVIENFIKDNAY
jgi:hypothetical protein